MIPPAPGCRLIPTRLSPGAVTEASRLSLESTPGRTGCREHAGV
jgi:hypothetical protein